MSRVASSPENDMGAARAAPVPPPEEPTLSRVPPRCWADDRAGRAVECLAQGTDRLGLCPRHAAEILGHPVEVLRDPAAASAA